MKKLENHFDNITFLITHYNRSASLKRLLANLRDLSLSFHEILVSDDCSRPEHLDQLKEIEKGGEIRLVTTPVNKGLGNNLNKGQLATKTPYVLYVQEDFVAKPEFVPKLKSSLEMMEEDSSIDIARYYAYYEYPYLTPRRDGFFDMNFSFFSRGYKKFAFYSDHPHLRRSNFFERFGMYKEGIPLEKTEFSMMMSVLQNKGKAIYYRDFQSLFDQINDVEPSSVGRSNWMEKRRQSPNIFIVIARQLYRYTTYNYKYLFINARRESVSTPS